MRRSSQSRQRDEPYVEIQIQPASSNHTARSLGLGKRQTLIGLVGLALLGLYLLLGLALAVPVAGKLLSRREYAVLISERTTQGERLQSLIEALGAVAEGTETLLTRVRHIHLTHGLDEAAIAERDPPLESATAPESIYAGLVGRGNIEVRAIAHQLVGLGALVTEVEEYERLHSDLVRTTPTISPLGKATFVLTSPFGSRRNPFTRQIDQHAGLDLAAVSGTPIVAPADGIVTFAGRYQLRLGVAWWRYGNMVALRHDDRFVTVFGHCDAVKVRRGQRVTRGDVIATVGNSGWSTNPHLHYEVRRSDDQGSYHPLDPRVFILDHAWRDVAQILDGTRRVLDPRQFEPLPRSLRR